MKKIKFEHHLAEAVRNGKKTVTWRIYDDKDLTSNDQVELIDKVDPKNPGTWSVIGVAIIDQVSEKRLRDINDSDYEGHEAFTSFDDMVTTLRGYYGPQVSPETTVKVVRFHLVDEKEAGNANNTTPIYKEIKLFTDGGSRGNPGPSACGFVIYTMDDKVILEKGQYLGVTTNNQAEYQGLKLGLEEAIKLRAREVHVYMDSMLVVNQMKGIFNIKNRDLWPIHEAVKELLASFGHVTFSHVPRELNKPADQQVNNVLDAQANTKS